MTKQIINNNTLNLSLEEVYNLVYKNTLFKLMVLLEYKELKEDSLENKLILIQYANPNILSNEIIDLLLNRYEKQILDLIGFYSNKFEVSFKKSVDMFMKDFKEDDCSNKYLKSKLNSLSKKYDCHKREDIYDYFRKESLLRLTI